MYVINTDEKDPHHLSDQIIIYQTFKTITFSNGIKLCIVKLILSMYKNSLIQRK